MNGFCQFIVEHWDSIVIPLLAYLAGSKGLVGKSGAGLGSLLASASGKYLNWWGQNKQ